MIGLLGGLAISWALLWLAKRKNLDVLMPPPALLRGYEFVIGFFSVGVLCAILQGIDGMLTHTTWTMAPNFDVLLIFKSLWWDTRSVLFEEFIFRGALLYLAIQYVGQRKGIILSAMAFGIYHWFSFGVLGNAFMMAIVFFMTALNGAAWAFAFARTRSMMLPIGFHLGWNFVFNSVFGKGPLKPNALFIPNVEHYVRTEGLFSLVNFLLPVIGTPLVCYLIVVWMTPKKEPIFK